MLDSGSSNIPLEEQEKFARHLYRYALDKIIIEEGEVSNAVYLLREGTIAIERMIGNKMVRISTIDAVNFFGEMSVILGVRRTATVRVISTQAVVYKFQFVDLKPIYANPAWAELLIARLSKDLVDTNNRSVGRENEILVLKEKVANFSGRAGTIFSALLSLQRDVAENVVKETRAEKLLIGMRELTETYLKSLLPEVYEKINKNNRAFLYELSEKDGFPEILKPLI